MILLFTKKTRFISLIIKCFSFINLKNDFMISLFVLVMNYSTHCNHICCNDTKLSLHHLYLQGKSCDELYHPFQTFTRMSSTKRQTSLFVTYDIDKKQVHLLKNCCIARRIIEYYSVNLFKFRANRYSKYIS